MRTDEQSHLASLTTNLGYALMIDLFEKDLRDLEALMQQDSNSEETDMRLLMRWKSLKTFIEKMKVVPQRSSDELENRTIQFDSLYPPPPAA